MTSPFAIGDCVTIAPEVARARDNGVTYVVRRHLTKNVVIEPEHGGPMLRINPEYLRPAAAAGATAVSVPYTPALYQGSVVTVTVPPGQAARLRQEAGQLWVVVRDDGIKTSIVKIGGDEGRYWRVPRTWLTVIDPARIALT